MKSLRFLLLPLFFIGIFNSASGQADPITDSIVASHIRALISLWDQYYTIDFEHYIPTNSKNRTDSAFAFRKVFYTKNTTRNGLFIQRNLVLQDIYRKDYGLSLTGSYQENFRSPLIDPDDIIAFQRRFILGVDWDLLKSGWHANQWKVESLKAELEDLKRKQKLESDQLSVLKTTEQITFLFNEQKATILQFRKELNKEHLIQLKKLWDLNQLPQEYYLHGLQNSTDIDEQVAINRSLHELLVKSQKQMRISAAPVLTIDIQKLVALANVQNLDSATLNADKVAHYESSYLDEISLKAFARYNYFDVYNNNLPNRSYVSVGLNVSLPLTFNSKEKNELSKLNYALQYDNKGEDIVRQDLEQQLTHYYLAYRNEFKQYIELLEQQRTLDLKIEREQMKRMYVPLEFNPNSALQLLDERCSNMLQLLDVHYRMYHILVRINEQLPSSDISDFTSPADPTSYLHVSTGQTNQRSLYVWSKSLQNGGVDSVTAYCIKNNIKEVLISYRNKKEYQALLKDFLNKNSQRNPQLIISNNQVIEKGIKSTLDSVKKAELPFVKGIHLDIEPHTFSNFKDNKDAYFKKYRNILQDASSFCVQNGLTLSVSIPLNYPVDLLNEIFSKCHRVYLMCYENVNSSFLERQTEEERKINISKIVIALRAKDFKTINQMEELASKLGTTLIAYHDYESMRELTKISLSEK